MKNSVQTKPSNMAYECFRLETETWRLPWPAAPHRHYYTECLFMRRGRCTVIRNGLHFTMETGDAMYIAPMVTHSVSMIGDEPIIVDMVKFSATQLREIPAYLAEIRATALDAESLHLPVLLSAEETKKNHIDVLFDALVRESQVRGFANDLKMRSLIYLLIIAACRHWKARSETYDRVKEKKPEAFVALPTYIEQQIGSSLRVEDLAKRCGMSYSVFAREFREFYGVSCKRFIEQVRVDLAEQYLLYSDLDLGDISARTGYTDASHMVKDFQRLRGMTPGAFRNSFR